MGDCFRLIGRPTLDGRLGSRSITPAPNYWLGGSAGKAGAKPHPDLRHPAARDWVCPWGPAPTPPNTVTGTHPAMRMQDRATWRN